MILCMKCNLCQNYVAAKNKEWKGVCSVFWRGCAVCGGGMQSQCVGGGVQSQCVGGGVQSQCVEGRARVGGCYLSILNRLLTDFGAFF